MVSPNSSGIIMLLKTPDALPLFLTNCSDILPYSETFFDVISTSELIAISVAAVLVVAIVIMFLESVYYVHRHFHVQKTKTLSLWILGLHPVFSVTAFIAVCVPRSSLICDLVATVYLSSTLRIFLILMIHYHGGEDAMVQRMDGDVINLRSPPLCCCFCCCPKLPINKRNLHRIKLSVWQVAVLRPILVFLATVMWTDGKYIKGKIEPNQAYIYLSTLTILSTVVALYGLVMLYRASRKHLQKLHIIPKFISVQFVLIFSNIQGIIFTLLSRYNLPPCRGILSSSARGDALYHLLLIGQMFLLAVLARCYYRRNDGALTLAEISVESISEEGTLDNKMIEENGSQERVGQVVKVMEGGHSNGNSGQIYTVSDKDNEQSNVNVHL